jgi:uncharacterized protein YbjT (DUF2867 family)
MCALTDRGFAGRIADAAVETLLRPGHDGKVYDLTGPRLLTYADAVREISAATGREVGFRRITPDEFGALLASFGVPDDAVSLVQYLFGTLFDGRNAHLGDGVQEILGRAPRDFGDFARSLE